MTDPKIIQALDLADKGQWDEAHRIVASMDSPEAAWVHANLHREEGDTGNAAYWYRRAGKEPSEQPCNTERAAIRGAALG